MIFPSACLLLVSASLVSAGTIKPEVQIDVTSIGQSDYSGVIQPIINWSTEGSVGKVEYEVRKFNVDNSQAMRRKLLTRLASTILVDW